MDVEGKMSDHPDLIYKGQDKYGPIEILEKDGLRFLCFGKQPRQSEMSLSKPYQLTFEYLRLMAMALLFCPNPKSVLMLGLGGGSLAKFFWKYVPDCNLDLVERSELVVELCSRYFALPNDPRLHIYNTEALDFLKQGEHGPYDLIFIDLFGNDGMFL